MKNIAGETKVTDFSEGSEIRNLIESQAVDIYYLMELENDVLKQAFIDTATGNWLDKHGLHPIVQLPRLSGVPARGTVTFSIPAALNSDFVIPTDTLLISDNNVNYLTDGECIILSGETSASVGVTCSISGVEGNIGADTLTKIDDINLTNAGVTVTNSLAFTGGVDYEDDEAYRSRLLSYVRRDDFGSVPYYIELAESVPGVHDVVLVDEIGYTKKILINGTTKPTTDSLLLKVLTVFSALGNTVLNHTFTVGKPTFDSFNLAVTITTNRELSETTLKNYLWDYFNGGSHIEGLTYPGLNISQGVSEAELSSIFNIFEDIQSATFKINNNTITKIDCTANHVLLLNEITITQTVL